MTTHTTEVARALFFGFVAEASFLEEAFGSVRIRVKASEDLLIVRPPPHDSQ